IGAPNTWVKIGRLIVEDYVRERGLKADVWLRAYQNNPVGALAMVKAGFSGDIMGAEADVERGDRFRREAYFRALEEFGVSFNSAFLSQFDLDKIQFRSNSDVQKTTLRTDATVYRVGVNIQESDIRLIIAIMDNESDKSEDWLGIATTVLNGSEHYEITIQKWIEDNCLDIRWLQGTTIDGTYYEKHQRKEQIYAFSRGNNLDGKGLKHSERYGEMRAIVEWTMLGNRVFTPEIQHWATGSGGYEAFSTTHLSPI
ncbi:MAG: hypothetical protein FWG90_10985, partial [Oscillospiraceae bacterium]|nr:hypothetical protein [Oscillospiraceae bacterium]